MESGGRTSRSRGSSSNSRSRKPAATVRFAICLDNEDAVDLVPGKLYQVLPDRDALAEDFLRVIDESGEDYLYPAEMFRVIRLPANIADRLSRARVG
jgi:hypothetical protein